MPADQIAVAVSTVIFTVRERSNDSGALMIPLVRRIREPFRDQWALPGGWLDPAESLVEAAGRTLKSATGLAPGYLEQLYAFGEVARSPARVVSVVYSALLRSDFVDEQRSTAAAPENVAWFAVDELPSLAFDHRTIIDYAIWRLRTKAAYTRIAHALLPDEFTLAELREVYEVVLGTRLDPSNFRRLIESSEALIATDEYRTGSHRPARLYRYNPELALADPGPLEAPGQ